MNWFAVIDNTGACVSLATDVDPKTLPAGLTALALDPAWKPDGTYVWDAVNRVMVAAPVPAQQPTALQLAKQLVSKGVITNADITASLSR